MYVRNKWALAIRSLSNIKFGDKSLFFVSLCGSYISERLLIQKIERSHRILANVDEIPRKQLVLKVTLWPVELCDFERRKYRRLDEFRERAHQNETTNSKYDGGARDLAVVRSIPQYQYCVHC